MVSDCAVINSIRKMSCLSASVLLILTGLTAFESVSAKPPAAPEILAVRRFLRAEEIRDKDDLSARFWTSRLPGTSLILAYVQSQGDCGTGGCTLLLLRPNGASFKVESYYPAILRPVTLLPTRHSDQPDLGVRCRCASTENGWAVYQVPLRFNGWRYRRLNVLLTKYGQRDRGRILISRLGAGYPLY